MRTIANILAAEQTKFGELYDYSLADLAREAVSAACKCAGTEPAELDLVVVASMTASTLTKQGNWGAWLTQIVGLRCPVISVDAACAGGGSALGVGLTYLQAGSVEKILVLGLEKLTDFDNEEVSSAMLQAADAEEEASCGLTFPALNALVAERFFYEHPEIGREALMEVAIKNHLAGSRNPWAHLQKKLTEEEYLSSEMVSWPLRVYDCAPVSDGAVALVLSAKPRKAIAQVVGFVQEQDRISLHWRPRMTSMAASRAAMAKLVRQTGIRREEIKLAELHDAFTILELIAKQDLGLNNRVDLVINPSGGLKACGHPPAATGLRQIRDLCLRLQKGELGLAQNLGGLAGTVTLTLVTKK